MVPAPTTPIVSILCGAMPAFNRFPYEITVKLKFFGL
jgi:hypothetical protein